MNSRAPIRARDLSKIKNLRLKLAGASCMFSPAAPTLKPHQSPTFLDSQPESLIAMVDRL